PRAPPASSSVEHSLGPLHQLPLPLMDLRRVNPVQRPHLTRRLHFPHCRQCHLRLERRRMNLPCPGHHDLPFLVMVFYLNHWSRFWGPPYFVGVTAVDAVRNIESQSATNFVDRILQDEPEISETILKTFIQPLANDIAGYSLQQNPKFFGCGIVVTKSPLTRKRNQLVDALARDLLAVSVPQVD